MSNSSLAKKAFAVGSSIALAASSLAFSVGVASAATHAVGQNVSKADGTVGMILPGPCLSWYTSAGAFLSYGFNSWAGVVSASAEDLALPTCSQSYIAPAPGTIIFADRDAANFTKGTGAFMGLNSSGGVEARGFVSADVFNGLGFKFANGSFADISWMTKGANIDNVTAVHPAGSLVNDNGTIKFVGLTGTIGIPDVATFNTWGMSFKNTVPANAADKALTMVGVLAPRQPGQLVPVVTAGNPPPVSGPISAMLASDNPASGTIVAGQATADLLHVTFTGNGTVGSLMLKRTGISDQNTLSNVYLYDGATRLTDGYSFNSTGDLTINNLNLAVNGSKTIAVKADVLSSTPSGQTIAVALTSLTPSGGSAATFNVMGNLMSVASGSTLATASLSANTVTGSPTVNAGTTAYVFWSAPLQVNTRTLWLKAANFRMIGSAPVDALSNLKMFVDGVDTGKVGMVTTTNGSNYVTFDFMATPLSLTTGSHTISVRADIQKGSNRNVTFSIQNASDLMIFDPQVGVNIAVSGTIPNSAASISIGTGSITAVLDPAFQSMTNATGGASNVAIAKFKLHAYGEDVKVQSLSVTPVLANTCFGATSGFTFAACTGGTAAAGGSGLQNVTLYFNGSQIGTQTASWTSGAILYQLGSQMIVPAGTDSTLEVRADLRSAVAGGNYTDGSVSANLPFTSCTVNCNNAQGQSSFNTVSVPTAPVTGNVLTIQTGLLAVSKNTGYASQSVSPNTANVKIGSFVLQNQSSSESVRITSLVVGLTTDGSTAMTTLTSPPLTNFSALKTSETSGSGSTPVQPQATNTFSVDFTLAPGAFKTVDVFSDTSTAASGAVVTTLAVSSIGVSSNVSATSGTVVGQTISLATGTVTNPPTLLTASSTTAQYVAAANGGATDATKATYNFAATGGSATISELKFAVNSQDVSTASVDTDANSTGSQTLTVTSTVGFLVGDTVSLVASTTNGYGIITSITPTTTMVVNVKVASVGTPSAVRLVPATVTNIKVGTASAQPVNGLSYLTGLSLLVPNGGSGLNQDVFVSYSEVGTNGVLSGSSARIALVYAKYTSGGTTSTLCTAAVGSCTATLAVGGVSSPIMTLVGSKPTLTAAKPNSVLAAGGTVEVIDVTVTADPKGNITLNTLPVTVVGSGGSIVLGAGTGIIVKDASNNTVDASGSAYSSNVSTITFNGGYTIQAGQSQTFKIFVPVTSFTPSGVNSVSVSASLPGTTAFTWTDTAGAATVVQSGTTLIPSYPSTFTSVIYN